MTQFGLKTSSSRKAIKTTLDKYKKKTEWFYEKPRKWKNRINW
jgi:hypothetical protein